MSSSHPHTLALPRGKPRNRRALLNLRPVPPTSQQIDKSESRKADKLASTPRLSRLNVPTPFLSLTRRVNQKPTSSSSSSCLHPRHTIPPPRSPASSRAEPTPCLHRPCSSTRSPAEPTPPPATPTIKRRGRTRADPSPRNAAKPPHLARARSPPPPRQALASPPAEPTTVHTSSQQQMTPCITSSHPTRSPYRGHFITPPACTARLRSPPDLTPSAARGTRPPPYPAPLTPDLACTLLPLLRPALATYALH